MYVQCALHVGDITKLTGKTTHNSSPVFPLLSKYWVVCMHAAREQCSAPECLVCGRQPSSARMELQEPQTGKHILPSGQNAGECQG